MGEEGRTRPNVDPRKVCAYIMKLSDMESHFHGEMTIKWFDGNIVNLRSEESIDLNMFRMDE